MFLALAVPHLDNEVENSAHCAKFPSSNTLRCSGAPSAHRVRSTHARSMVDVLKFGVNALQRELETTHLLLFFQRVASFCCRIFCAAFDGMRKWAHRFHVVRVATFPGTRSLWDSSLGDPFQRADTVSLRQGITQDRTTWKLSTLLSHVPAGSDKSQLRSALPPDTRCVLMPSEERPTQA
jgi:hypothetical protein